MNSYHKTRYEDENSRGSGFIMLLLLAFVVTGIFRATTPQERIQAIDKQSMLIHQTNGIRDRFFHLSDSLQMLAAQKGRAYSCDDFVQARNLLTALSDSMAQVSFNGTPPSTISFLLTKAQRNCDLNRLPFGAEMLRAEQKYGEPPTIHDGRITLAGTVSFFSKLLLHALWFGIFVVPFLLVGRVLISRRFTAAAFKWIFDHPIWLATCSFFWLGMSLRYGDKEPRVTARFFLLRFQYMWNQRKVFLTVTEKEALLISSGKPGMKASIAFSFVSERVASATESGRRLAIVSFFATILPAFQLAQPAMAQDQSVLQVEQSKPELKFSGYGIASLQSDRVGKNAVVDYARVGVDYTHGNWSIAGMGDAVSSNHVKWFMLGRSFSGLGKFKGLFQIGRLIRPYAYLFANPMKDQAVRLPLDDALGTVFFTEGASVSVSRSGFSGLAGVFNGSTDYGGNGHMDFGARMGYSHGGFSSNLTWERGHQPNGIREMRCADAELSIGRIWLRLIGLERPDLSCSGFLTAMAVRAGPCAFAVQYDQAETNAGIQRHVDAGVNVTVDKQSSVQAHVVASPKMHPQFILRMRLAVL